MAEERVKEYQKILCIGLRADGAKTHWSLRDKAKGTDKPVMQNFEENDILLSKIEGGAYGAGSILVTLPYPTNVVVANDDLCFACAWAGRFIQAWKQLQKSKVWVFPISDEKGFGITAVQLLEEPDETHNTR